MFIISAMTTTIALSLLSFIGINLYSSAQASSEHNSSWMQQQMQNGMMGQTGANNSILNNYWVFLAVALVSIVIIVLVLMYYLGYPKYRSEIASQTGTLKIKDSVNSTSAYESIEKTLTEDERRIINNLKLHQGKYLQKYITKETGLSKLKTHRIVTRLSQRGMVSIEKTGNTNTVSLADWLQKNISAVNKIDEKVMH